eukprot:2835783-Amphidinium_carterae.2
MLGACRAADWVYAELVVQMMLGNIAVQEEITASLCVSPDKDTISTSDLGEDSVEIDVAFRAARGWRIAGFKQLVVPALSLILNSKVVTVDARPSQWVMRLACFSEPHCLLPLVVVNKDVLDPLLVVLRNTAHEYTHLTPDEIPCCENDFQDGYTQSYHW